MNSPCRKRKRSENSNKPNIYGLTNYSPNIPIGDTVDTLSIFRDWLCTNYTQTNQNVDKIQALMIKTFYETKNHLGLRDGERCSSILSILEK